MSEDQHKKSPTVAEMDLAVRRAIFDSVREHALLGRSVPEFRDGRVVWVDPETILKMKFDDTPLGKPVAEEEKT